MLITYVMELMGEHDLRYSISTLNELECGCYGGCPFKSMSVEDHPHPIMSPVKALMQKHGRMLRPSMVHFT